MTLPDPSAPDIRATEDFGRVQQFFDAVYAPAFGEISNAVTLSASPDGSAIAFAGEVRTAFEGTIPTRLCLADGRGVRRLTDGDAMEQSPQFSPDGSLIAFTSDRATAGVQQLELFDVASGQVRETSPVPGTIEYLRWSPGGDRILLGVAGLGADKSGGEGSGTINREAEEGRPEWLPQVDSGGAEDAWRSAWVHDVATDTVRQISAEGVNVWEAEWSGPDAVVAVVSSRPDEGSWYTADLRTIDVATGALDAVHNSDRQLGWPVATPTGARIAVVQAICSDRWLVAGDAVVIAEGTLSNVDGLGTDITQLHWLDEQRLAFAGLRGLETVVGVHDVDTGRSTELWSSSTTVGEVFYPSVSFLPDGSAAVVHHAYDIYPELGWLRDGKVEVLASLRHPGADHLGGIRGTVETVQWTAPDGWEIQGLLSTPDTPGPHPLVVNVHGGPVWAYRNSWALGGVLTSLLVSRGYAVLHPNPRGSGGRGQEFAEAVFGDMGGADTHDYLSGIDHLVAEGVVDPSRVGVTGGSYGGYMSAWLITQDTRFAAAVPMSPVTNWYSQHHTSNISYFDEIFLKADPHAAGGRYHDRSPVMFADRARTPTLQTAGLEDRCTPPTQATEFHHALLDAGVVSICASYPGEGHGVRTFPAVIDHTTRVVDWFERHMPAQQSPQE